MQRFLFFLFLVLFYNSAVAQWNVNAISDSLLNSSNAVVRRYAVDIKIFETDKIEVAENLVITILDHDVVNHFRFYSIINDSLIDELLETKVFDVNGKRIKQAKAKFFQYGIIKNSGSLLKLLSSGALSFPLTIELEYKKSLSSIRDTILWKPAIDYGVSVQNASLRLSVSDTSSIGFLSNRINLTNRYINEDGLSVFLWELKNFPATEKGSLLELPLNGLPSLKINRKK